MSEILKENSDSMSTGRKPSVKRSGVSRKRISAEKAKQCSYIIASKVLIPEHDQKRDFKVMFSEFHQDVSMIILNELLNLVMEVGESYEVTPTFTLQELVKSSGLPKATARNALLKLEAHGVLKLDVDKSPYNRKLNAYVATFLPFFTDNTTDFFKSKFQSD